LQQAIDTRKVTEKFEKIRMKIDVKKIKEE